MDNKDYSIVIPVYFNEGSLESLESDIRKNVFLKMPERKGEIVFVDDGSRDRSYETLRKLQRTYTDDIRVYKLSRNFGQGNAIWCGLENTPSTVVVLSADGQEPVDVVPQMLRKHFDEGFEVVIGRRDSRGEAVDFQECLLDDKKIE